MITIIDYGMGNLRSVQKIFQRMNVQAKITNDHNEILKANKLLLPGVGHFANGMKKLEQSGLIEILNKKVLEEKTPILGICLGMQLMTKSSEEGDVAGLNWIDAQTLKFNFRPEVKFPSLQAENGILKIPHVGWNSVIVKKQTSISKQINADDSFYFVHSYFVKCNNAQDVLFETAYGSNFVSGFEKENIVAVQFHPEKSHQSGMKLIQNFMTN